MSWLGCSDGPAFHAGCVCVCALPFVSCQLSCAQHYRGLWRVFTALSGLEGGSREASDNPIWWQGRQRKWLGIPDGGHNQENSCKGLDFSASVWREQTASLFPDSLLFLPPFLYSSSLSPCLCLLPQIPNRKHTEVYDLANPLGILLMFFIISIFGLSSSSRHIYIYIFLPFFFYFSIYHPSVTHTALSCSVLFLSGRKQAASIWLWSCFTFLFFAWLEHRPLFNLLLFPSFSSINWSI